MTKNRLEKEDPKQLTLEEVQIHVKNSPKELQSLAKLFLGYLKHILVIEKSLDAKRERIASFEGKYRNPKSYKDLQKFEKRFSDGLNAAKKSLPLKEKVYNEIIKKFNQGEDIKKLIKKIEVRGFSDEEFDKTYWDPDTFFQSLPRPTVSEKLAIFKQKLKKGLTINNLEQKTREAIIQTLEFGRKSGLYPLEWIGAQVLHYSAAAHNILKEEIDKLPKQFKKNLPPILQNLEKDEYDINDWKQREKWYDK